MIGWTMARHLKMAAHPLPEHYERAMLETPVEIRFRRYNDTEGRGNSWEKGNLHGWDSHGVDEPCAIVYARNGGGWRTLQPSLWEIDG